MIRLLLVSGDSLFSEGLQSILSHQTKIQVVGQESDSVRAIERIKELRADVVIVDDDSAEHNPTELAAAIFRAAMKVKVIGLSHNDNTIYIYRRERRIAQGVEDLMNAIENDLPVSDLASPAELSALATVRSRVYGFLGAVYSRMPDEKFAASLSSPELTAFLSSLGEEEDVPADMLKGLRLIQSYARASQGRPVEELKTNLAVERTRLMRGVKPGYGPPPPYEFVYMPTDQQLRIQSQFDIRGMYAAAGVAIPDDTRDQPDYIGFELDFMRHLSEREAQAWVGSNDKEVMSLIEQEQAFLKQHVLAWIPVYCDVMLKEAQLDFYRGIALLTKGFLQGEAQRAMELEHGARIAQTA